LPQEDAGKMKPARLEEDMRASRAIILAIISEHDDLVCRATVVQGMAGALTCGRTGFGQGRDRARI